MNIARVWSKAFLVLHGKSIRNSDISRQARINYGSNIVSSKIGRYTYCGYDCWIIAADIGAFCSISNEVKIGGPAHPIDWVSTSPLFHNGKNMFKKHFSKHKFEPYALTKIGNDVWIGEGAMIKAGIEIGSGAVIGMGSVVTKNVGAYEIWAGNPAKFIRKRFNDELIDALLKRAWWDKPEEKIREVAELFTDPQKYINFGD